MRKLNFLTIPQNWISDITFQSNKSNKIIAFYKMGSFGSGYFRCVEKQIVFRKGLYLLDKTVHLLLLYRYYKIHIIISNFMEF